MFFDYDAAVNRIIAESDKLIAEKEDRRDFIVAYCRRLESYVMSLSLTESYHVNRTCCEVIQKIRDEIERVRNTVLSAHETSRNQIIQAIEQNLKTYLSCDL